MTDTGTRGYSTKLEGIVGRTDIVMDQRHELICWDTLNLTPRGGMGILIYSGYNLQPGPLALPAAPCRRGLESYAVVVRSQDRLHIDGTSNRNF